MQKLLYDPGAATFLKVLDAEPEFLNVEQQGGNDGRNYFSAKSLRVTQLGEGQRLLFDSEVDSALESIAL